MRIVALTLAFALAAAALPLNSAEARHAGAHWMTAKSQDGKVHRFRTMMMGGQRMILVPESQFLNMFRMVPITNG